jgi:hypothetical protein
MLPARDSHLRHEIQTVREARRQVLIRARMRAGGPLVDVCIRDASSRGMMLQAKTPPQRGAYVEIVGDELIIVGRVIWSKGHRFGVRTNEPMDVSATIRLVRADPARLNGAPKGGKSIPAPGRSSSEASRAWGRSLEFATIGLFAAALVFVLAHSVYEYLSRPFASVVEQLVGRH